MPDFPRTNIAFLMTVHHDVQSRSDSTGLMIRCSMSNKQFILDIEGTPVDPDECCGMLLVVLVADQRIAYEEHHSTLDLSVTDPSRPIYFP